MSRVTSLPLDAPLWFDLMTSDAPAAHAFYGALFGWQFDALGETVGSYAVCRIADAPAAGIGAIPPGQSWPSAWNVYFGVASLERTLSVVLAAGGQQVMPVEEVGDYGRMAFCADPTGAIFGLWQPGTHVGAGIIQEPGAMTWCEVNTRDAAGAAGFYHRVFGLDLTEGVMQGTPYHTLSRSGTPICGVLQMNEQWGDIPPHWMVYFAVQHADEAKHVVEAHGGTVPYGPFPTPFGRICVVQDPQGATFSVIETPAKT
jgi:uncharacterized protein